MADIANKGLTRVKTPSDIVLVLSQNQRTTSDDCVTLCKTTAFPCQYAILVQSPRAVAAIPAKAKLEPLTDLELYLLITNCSVSGTT